LSKKYSFRLVLIRCGWSLRRLGKQEKCFVRPGALLLEQVYYNGDRFVKQNPRIVGRGDAKEVKAAGSGRELAAKMMEA
jgi:hypothetical protein